ncbi:hypothetical protein HMPREF0454_04276 [Hafnia alvei ATCC 51873]|uniref:Uncharacterized protein n=1 Tax=Hafnia alvei ATCC 51873 TaxID=1002364 RepID=G9YCE3_HAFAL|nr:hypothetical protein HMPREF0454_04276 [Hafnia alvei ATCC 51873]
MKKCDIIIKHHILPFGNEGEKYVKQKAPCQTPQANDLSKR